MRAPFHAIFVLAVCLCRRVDIYPMKTASPQENSAGTKAPVTAGRWLQHLLVQIAHQAQEDLTGISERPKIATHALRRRMKKIQALLLLAAPCMEKESLATVRAGIRGIKDALTANRDADVLADLGRDLGVARRVAIHTERPDLTLLDAFVIELVTFTEHLNLRSLSWDDVIQSYLKTCRRARKAWKKSRRHPTAKTLHTWRKRVKDQYHQSLALHHWLGQTKSLRRIHRLGSLLGDCHDLDIFALAIDFAPPRRDDKELHRKMNHRRKKLKRRAFNRAEKVFNRPISKVKRRLSAKLGEELLEKAT